jgi:serine/threonine protein kinase
MNNKIVDCYQIVEMIGSGGNGIVYKGINLKSGAFVAMKEMPFLKGDNKLIKREISFSKQLQHKNIVQYLDAISTGNKIYLIL